MKKTLLLIIVLFAANLTKAQVNGFTLTDPAFPSSHNLGTSFPLNVSFNWTPATTSAITVINYNPALVSYDASCAVSLPSCINIINSGTQLTITMSSLAACTNTGAISFNVCFKFNCPDSCTGVIKPAFFTGILTDNMGTTQNANCKANGILNNNVSLTHNFYSFNQLTAEVTYKVCFNNQNCFYIKNPSFDISLLPAIGTITSVYGSNYTYTLNTLGGNIITPNTAVLDQNANDCFYYVVQLPCNTGLGQTLISNVTLKGTNCSVADSTIQGPVSASFTIPAVPAAASNISVSTASTSSYLYYKITNNGNTPLNVTATNLLPLAHLKNIPNSVSQNTTQAGLICGIKYYDCASTPTVSFPLVGNGATDANALATNTTKFDHTINDLLPGQSVNLYLYYDLSSSCSGPAGSPPYKDSLSILYNCATSAMSCISCDTGGIQNPVIIYNPQPNIECMQNQYIQGCKNIGDTINLCYEFKNNGDDTLHGGIFNIYLPAWLQVVGSSMAYTGFSTNPTIITSTNINFNLPDIPFGAGTYKICFQAIVQNGAVGGSNSFWSTASGDNLISQQYVCYTSFNICAFAAIGIDKKVKGSLDGSFANSGTGSPNSFVDYQITITNTGTIAVDSLVVIDRIPEIGNLTILGSPNSAAVSNQFNMVMLPAPVDINYTAEYTTTQNICTGWSATGIPCNTGIWGGAVANGGVKFTFTPAFTLAPGASYTFTFQTKIPDSTANGLIDCNTAGFIATAKTGGYNVNPVETLPVCIQVVNDSCNFLCNSDFEILNVPYPTTFLQTPEANVPCWHTTASDGQIEIWNGAGMSVPAYSGAQFAELNCTQVGTLYQNFTAVPGSTVVISFAHRGRAGFTNNMSVSIEPAPIGSGIAVPLGTYNAITTAWTLHSVSNTFPNNMVTAYVLSFVSLPLGGTSAGGNFLDAINIACPSDICGSKFNDLNANGVWDAGEPGLPNWSINLTGTQTLTTTTDSAGHYCFSNLPAGNYTVAEVNQINWQQTSPSLPGIYNITLIPAQHVTDINFGNNFGQTDPCSKTDVHLTQLDTADCCYLVEISNQYLPNYFTGISITSDNLTIANVSSGNTWSTITYQSPTHIVFNETNINNGIPLDGAMGFQTIGTICFAGSGPHNITVSFIGPAPAYDTICPKEITVNCGTPPDTSCVGVLDLAAVCDSGAIIMKFRIKNNSGFTMRGLTLYSQNPDVTASPHFIPIPDLLPGQTSSYFETSLIIANNATTACFFISACDQNTEPGPNGPYPSWCCMDSILYCVNIPTCDPCGGISVTATMQDSVNCCYDLTLSSNYNNANIDYIEFIGVGGTQFALLSGWSIIPPVGSSHIKIKAPGLGITPGVYPDFASFCLTGTSSPPYTVLINIIDNMGVVLCTDTLNFVGCQLVVPSCANIINDSLYCSGDQIKYTFFVKNNSPFTLYQIDYKPTDISVILDSNHTIPNPPIVTGGIGGPFTVTILSKDSTLDMFCMYLTGHNGIYDPEHGLAATECCTDSLGVICLPMITCGACDTCVGCDSTICCSFGNMSIPNGITPNDDGKNDVFEILNSTCCTYISIKVFNRWGNMVYHNDNYQNDWKGVNDSGTKLVQGTYFVILELPTGNKKETYIDIRY